MATTPRKPARTPTSQRRTTTRGKSSQGMSLTFLILILFILAIVVFFLAFREPLARFAAGNRNSGAVSSTASPSPPPAASPLASGKKNLIVVDGGQSSPSASPEVRPTPTPIPTATPKQTGKPKPSASPAASAKPSHNPGDGQEDLKTVVLYFTRVDDNGHILMDKESRAIKFSDSPLSSSIRALLKGPNSTELSNGVVSMIPAGTNLLSAWVRDSIAYLNFSENFQFNPLGADGLRAQVRQVVWVATEFPTVKAVQILIEGKNVEYLGGDNVAVGKPLSRQSLP